MSLKSTLKTERRFLLGNEAIALAAVLSCVSFATSYPGTPSSEILPAFFKFSDEMGMKVCGGWMINEKVAFESALAASWSGLRAMVSMKQVGLNVATDPLMSAAYTGVKAGFVVVSVDDPGPHSSQTEQDSRFHAAFAKIPVFDPASPQDAFCLFQEAIELSEEFEIPVMLRPVLRVAHSRESIEIEGFKEPHCKKITGFEKDPERWAATPKFRLTLHRILNKKLKYIAQKEAERLKRSLRAIRGKRVYIASGVMYSYALDLELKPLLRIKMPFPLDQELLYKITEDFEEIWVLEETYPLIELQIPDRKRVKGRITGHIPQEGELDLDTLEAAVKKSKKKHFVFEEKKPRLCPGCGHRPVFYAIRKAFPEGVYPGDIGCYTLGVNLKAVDTCLCMGASISQAIGFAKAFEFENKEVPVIATIGDSTFLHSGIPALIEAVNQKAKAIFIVLDNKTTAMTGGQPVIPVDFQRLIKACGVEKVEKVYAYALTQVIQKLKDCWYYVLKDKKPAVLICESPCVLYNPPHKRIKVKVTERCTNCGICYSHFECPAIHEKEGKAHINEELCTGCGVCVEVCPVKAIKSLS